MTPKWQAEALYYAVYRLTLLLHVEFNLHVSQLLVPKVTRSKISLKSFNFDIFFSFRIFFLFCLMPNQLFLRLNTIKSFQMTQPYIRSLYGGQVIQVILSTFGKKICPYIVQSPRQWFPNCCASTNVVLSKFFVVL